MGRAWCGDVVVPVARRMRELGIPDGQRADALEVLVRELQGQDWDTEDEALAELADDEAAVEAFRRCKVILPCDAMAKVSTDTTVWCDRERLPRGHEDGQHEGGGHKWPVTA